MEKIKIVSSLEIAELIEKDLLEKRIPKAQIAKRIGKERTNFSKTLIQLKNKTNKVPFNAILKILNEIGYQMILVKN